MTLPRPHPDPRVRQCSDVLGEIVRQDGFVVALEARPLLALVIDRPTRAETVQARELLGLVQRNINGLVVWCERTSEMNALLARVSLREGVAHWKRGVAAARRSKLRAEHRRRAEEITARRLRASAPFAPTDLVRLSEFDRSRVAEAEPEGRDPFAAAIRDLAEDHSRAARLDPRDFDP